MNTQALNDMKDMLREVEAGTWKPSPEKRGVEDWLDAMGGPLKFELEQWGGPVVDDDTGEPCGFSACAVGHACLDDRFPMLTAGHEEGTDMIVSVEGREGGDYIMEQLGDVFGITSGQAHKLFMPDVCERGSPRDVINRINTLLEANS